MSIVRADENLYPFALSYMFKENRGFGIVLEMFAGTMPTKAAFEAADIFKADGLGWIDVPKLETFLSGYPLVRRWKLDDFSNDIIPISRQKVKFDFGSREYLDYMLDKDAYNEFNSGTVTWYLMRSIDSANTTCHYMFSGTISDLEGIGDMVMLRRNLLASDFVMPGTINVDFGALSVL